MIKIVEDRYDGVTIDYNSLPQSLAEFETDLEIVLNEILDKKLLWVKIPLEKSDFIPTLTKLGFQFHSCNTGELLLVKKLIKDPVVPTAKNFTLGVGAIIMDKGSILVVKDRFYPGYKLPGGHVDNNENIKDAFIREVYEETGIEAEFESILNLGHFKGNQFGESSLYLVCTGRALTKDIKINDSLEIIEAKWMNIDKFLSLDCINIYNRRVVEAAINNRDLKLTEQRIKLKVDGEVFF